MKVYYMDGTLTMAWMREFFFLRLVAHSEAYSMERLDIAGIGGNVVVDNVRDLRYSRTGMLISASRLRIRLIRQPGWLSCSFSGL
jgi:hypothetical protein